MRAVTRILLLMIIMTTEKIGGKETKEKKLCFNQENAQRRESII
jgi:hypothetical protein